MTLSSPGDLTTSDSPGAAETRAAITSRLFGEGNETREVALGELRTLAADDNRFVWIDLNGYGQADLKAVSTELDMPEAAVQAVFGGRMRPCLNVYGERFFVAVAVPQSADDAPQVELSELDLFVGRNYLVSAHQRPLPFTERALERAVLNPAMLKLDSTFLLSILIDELIATYEELTDELEVGIEPLSRASCGRISRWLAARSPCRTSAISTIAWGICLIAWQRPRSRSMARSTSMSPRSRGDRTTS